MPFTRARVSHAAALLIGLLLGCVVAGSRPTVLRAGGGDRSGDSVLAAGPIFVRYNEGSKIQVPQDALYYLDYKAGRLLATVPSVRQSVGGTKILDTFVERDLVADFKLDLDNSPRPHFLMTTGSLGTYGDGMAPLYVFESTTNQVAIYKVQPQTIGISSQPKFELVEVRSFGKASSPPPAP
jgi:hypothetical protein